MKKGLKVFAVMVCFIATLTCGGNNSSGPENELGITVQSTQVIRYHYSIPRGRGRIVIVPACEAQIKKEGRSLAAEEFVRFTADFFSDDEPVGAAIDDIGGILGNGTETTVQMRMIAYRADINNPWPDKCSVTSIQFAP